MVVLFTLPLYTGIINIFMQRSEHMCKFTSLLTMALWALVVAFIIKNTSIEHNPNNLSISIHQDSFGYLLVSTLLVTAFNYIYYHLIYSRK